MLLVAVSVFVWKAPAELPDTDFFGIVAKVIPVLIVVIALDGRGQGYVGPHAS